MSAQFFIRIEGLVPEGIREIEFFTAESWDRETEANLLRLIPEVFSMMSKEIKALKIEITVSANNPRELISSISKKQKNGLLINNYKLSSRELDVLTLIMNGYTNKEIAKNLFVCFETVKSHRKNILLKTGCRNTAMLINHYHQTFFEKE